MRILVLLMSLLLAAQATAEVCVENDTNLPENAFSYGFIPQGQLDLKNPAHPILTLPSDFKLNPLASREDECIAYIESEPKGTPGYLVINIKPAATSEQAYTSEDIAYVSYDLATAPAASTLMLPVGIRAGDVPNIKSKLDNGPFTKFGMRRVFIPSDK
jgi:hypothetical protein